MRRRGGGPPADLVDLGGIGELKGIRAEGGDIVIGAMTTQHELIADATLAARLPLLRETALLIADPQVRYVGTIGGNVAQGDPGNDMPAVMLWLGATFQIAGKGRERRGAGAAFFGGAPADPPPPRAEGARAPHLPAPPLHAAA